MIGGDFLQTRSGDVWIVGFTFRLRKRLPGYEKGEHALAYRFERLEGGSEIAFAAMLPRDFAFDLRCRARTINRRIHIDGKHLLWAGERVWADFSDSVQFHKTLEREDGSKFYVMRWKLCLAQYRGVELGPVVHTRTTPAWEV